MTITEIIKACGQGSFAEGARRIAEQCGGGFQAASVYKWPQIGIPEIRWRVVIDLHDGELTPAALYAANNRVRGEEESAA